MRERTALPTHQRLPDLLNVNAQWEIILIGSFFGYTPSGDCTKSRKSKPTAVKPGGGRRGGGGRVGWGGGGGCRELGHVPRNVV